jgi:hypothetical protein
MTLPGKEKNDIHDMSRIHRFVVPFRTSILRDELMVDEHEHHYVLSVSEKIYLNFVKIYMYLHIKNHLDIRAYLEKIETIFFYAEGGRDFCIMSHGCLHFGASLLVNSSPRFCR